MDRKSFIRKLMGSMLVSIPIYSILSCSDSEIDPIPTPDKNCLMNGAVGSISSNHGHSLIVSNTDVDLGIAKQYNIQGSSSHNHMVTVTDSDFASLKINQQISITSTSGDGHIHSVTISCA